MTTTYSVLSKDNAIAGTDIYRSSDKTIPLAFRPTVEHIVNPNKDGSNHMCTVKVTVPHVRIVDSKPVSTDQFVATLKFTSIQSITAEAERALCLQTMKSVLVLAYDDLLSGMLPDNGYTIVPVV